MELMEITNRQHEQEFLDLPDSLHASNPEWIRPLDTEIRKIFDPQKNKFFRHGEAQRWILKDANGKCIGRVAAFINKRLTGRNDQPTGGMGFFECIDDQEAADLLFHTCKDWNEQRGMKAMEGPVNFGERDKFWGLLVDGFYEPVYNMNYNPPYYQKLFETYGFKEYFKQYCYSLRPEDPIDPKFRKYHDQLLATGDFKVLNPEKNNLKKYAKDFSIIYNKAWARHGGGKEISPEVAFKMFQTMKPVMDTRIIYFAYHKEDPIGFWINLPELNQYFKRLKGKFDLIHKLYFLYLKRFTRNSKFYGLVFGVVPEYQGKGIDGLMIVHGQDQIMRETPYRDMELQWIGDFNPKMISIAKSIGTRQSRTLITYRFLFDRNAEFLRMPILG